MIPVLNRIIGSPMIKKNAKNIDILKLYPIRKNKKQKMERYISRKQRV